MTRQAAKGIVRHTLMHNGFCTWRRRWHVANLSRHCALSCLMARYPPPWRFIQFQRSALWATESLTVSKARAIRPKRAFHAPRDTSARCAMRESASLARQAHSPREFRGSVRSVQRARTKMEASLTSAKVAPTDRRALVVLRIARCASASQVFTV